VKRFLALVLLVCATACVAPPEWQHDMQVALSESRQASQDLIVYFALPGRDASDLMESRLGDPVVIAALQRGKFAAVIVDGIERKRLYSEWIGGGEGMGVCVLDGQGYCYAARPGPQDPEEVAAFLDMCASKREELAMLRAMLQQATVSPMDQHALGSLLLDLGCRVHCEPLLIDAALAGVADAKHRLARLYALDGNLTAARRWLKVSPKTPSGMLTEGYVLFKERRHGEAAKVLAAAVASKRLNNAAVVKHHGPVSKCMRADGGKNDCRQ